MGSAECRLFGLGKVLVDVLVELHLADISHGDQFFGPDFRGIENVKVELVLAALWNDLDAEFPGWVDAHIDSCIEIFAVEIGILTSELEGFVPDERMNAQRGGEVELDEVSLVAVVFSECESIDSKALHHSVGAWDAAVGHGPHEHVCCFCV